MRRALKKFALPLLLTCGVLSGIMAARAEMGLQLPEDWSTQTPRDELRRSVAFEASSGPNYSGCFVIEHDCREGFDEWFETTTP